MAENEVYFVEWMEEFVSQERGSRIVHYILKDSEGKSVLAVVGTERSLRHMVYVVADEFLTYAGPDSPIQAGFKWRSRREVVDWLTSMLAKQQQAESPRDSTKCLGSSAQRFSVANKVDHRVRHLKQSYSDIVWLGASWICGKQLKHYHAFCRNGTTIAAQSFIFVMAKEESRYVAYLEDMYEDKKGQKKVKVRWFHHSQEVKGVVRLRNAHPKEVYITPYTQVISVECVDGPAIVLTRDHFEKCIGDFPDSLLGKVHLCFRQFRSNKIKPFDLSKLRGYADQPLVSCLDSDTFLNSDSGVKVVKKGEHAGKGIKRMRNSGDQESLLTSNDGEESQWKKIRRAPLSRGCYSAADKNLLFSRNVEIQRWHAQLFKVDDKIELLCQDSGIRGCWFRCTVLEISRKRMKLQYTDLEDQDGYRNLQEWVPAFRLASPDKLGLRCLGRSTIRPCPPSTSLVETQFDIGDPVDAWWSDGWWEGAVTAVNNDKDSNVQVYIPGENLYLDVPRTDLRISRDWVSGKWVDVKSNRDILSAIGPASKVPMGSTSMKDEVAGNSEHKIKVDGNENKETGLATPSSSGGHPEQVSSSDKGDRDDDHHVNDKSDHLTAEDMCCDGDTGGNVDVDNVGTHKDDGERDEFTGAEVLKTLTEKVAVGENDERNDNSDAKVIKSAAQSEEEKRCDDDIKDNVPNKA